MYHQIENLSLNKTVYTGFSRSENMAEKILKHYPTGCDFGYHRVSVEAAVTLFSVEPERFFYHE